MLIAYRPAEKSISIDEDGGPASNSVEYAMSEWGWNGKGEIPASVYESSDATLAFLKGDLYKRPQVWTVSVEYAEVLAKPGGGIVSEAVFLEPVNKISPPKDGYVQVELPVQRGYRGYIRENQIAPVDCTLVRELAVVRKLNATGYKADSGEGRTIIPPGAILPVTAVVGDAVQVATPLGPLWVESAAIVRIGPGEKPDSDAILAAARIFIGQPYKWGGTSFSHMDCSGFVQLAFRMNGVLLRRDADIQFADGSAAAVPENEAGACDLLFIATYKTTASHVGILTGDGKIIHASPQKGVVEEPLDKSTFSRHKALGSRRFLTADGGEN